jgi:asparagine synthase (glutamine-hydrolysing)
MCGIAGCVMPSGGRPHVATLERMVRALDHRGPDESGIEIVGSVGLGHTRLAIVDPTPAGAQPMRHPDGRWWITFNGEVFNHVELRGQLPPADYRGHSDTETLLHALAEWGEAAVERCNGLFAFAALDLERRRLLLVRDRFGKKPLYLARDQGGVLWFASELRALLEAGIPRSGRPDLLGHAAVHGWINGRLAPLEGVERIPPGTLLSVDLDTLAVAERRWYDPAGAVDPELARELSGLSRGRLTARLDESLRAAVTRRLMSDVPLGTMCSGGLDSSLVTAIARDAHPSITAFNASARDDPALDEGPWAERVATVLGVELRTIDVTVDSWRQALVAAVEHYEYPLAHESSVPIAAIASLARAHGVKVLLTGEGADELFGGYWFMHRELYAQFLPPRARMRHAVDRLRRLGPRRLPGLVLGRLRRSEDDGSSGGLEPAEAPREFERAVAAGAARAFAHHSGARGELEAALLGGLSLGTLPLLLNRMDKNAMQWSVETRVPFLDPDLVALVLNLPLEQRVGPEPKGLLRDVARMHLPADVARRPKQVGLAHSAREQLLAGARPEFLERGSLRELLGFDDKRWHAFARHAAGHNVVALWTTEIWCRLMLEQQPREQVEEELWR